ncbi:MAG: ABC-2 family transporter protein [Candidatus Heimdallarchaeota archaeon]
MSYKMIYQYPFMIVGGFIEGTATLMAFVIFWQVILVGQSFGTWKMEEILIFTALAYFAWGLASLFFTGVWVLPNKIIEGDIERWLCRPIRHPLLGVLFEEVWVGGSALLVVSILLMSLVGAYYHMQFQLLNLILAFISLAIGITTLYLLYGSITALAGFTIGRAEFVQEAFDTLEITFARVPATSLPRGITTFLMVGFPVAFLSAFPTEILLGRLSVNNAIEVLILQVPLCLFWIGTFLIIWKVGISRYESASN